MSHATSYEIRYLATGLDISMSMYNVYVAIFQVSHNSFIICFYAYCVSYRLIKRQTVYKHDD